MTLGNSGPKPPAPDPGYVIKDGVLTNATYKGVPGTDYAVPAAPRAPAKRRASTSPRSPWPTVAAPAVPRTAMARRSTGMSEAISRPTA
ncbi:hypothetical protein G6F50_017948 [Rhizopus delemar]|uniref:Uncharacterized protein n=1 Tax=Rhizopus delemar TaxID=936053 RepID=A0A9P7BZL2_9FUNG|nr:hypothetical protein G6F50_017948 [Rhizopus delemar]